MHGNINKRKAVQVNMYCSHLITFLLSTYSFGFKSKFNVCSNVPDFEIKFDVPIFDKIFLSVTCSFSSYCSFKAKTFGPSLNFDGTSRSRERVTFFLKCTNNKLRPIKNSYICISSKKNILCMSFYDHTILL